MPVAIAICDDEKIFRDEISCLVKKRVAESRVDCYDSGESLLESEERYDIYMLDILMPGVSGLELSRQIRDKEEHPAPIIIFITALKDHMQDAFDVQAYHFLVKPIDRDKFISVLHRAVNECQKRADQASLVIKSGSETFVLPYDDILFAESRNKKVVIQKVHDNTYHHNKRKL